MTPALSVRALAWRGAGLAPVQRMVPAEVPVAFSYDFIPFGVMMATPADLEDFAYGFTLTEGIIATPAEIAALEILPAGEGFDCRMMLRHGLPPAVQARRRVGAGPVGCGLCGVEQIEAAMRALPRVSASPRLAAPDLHAAMQRLPALQALNNATRAVHGAGFWSPASGAIMLREDAGRHNALDKLAGALARAGIAAASGALLLTSRVSIELIQKAAMMGAPVLAAVSAPTALAIRAAEAANITLVAIARADGFEIFTHPERIAAEVTSHVA